MEVFGKRMRKYIDFKGNKLAPFGTPMPLHGVNPRNMLDNTTWNKLKEQVYKKFNYSCAICGSNGVKQGYEHKVECHEIWDYDFDKQVQYFEGLVALCPICHKVIHWDQNRMALNSSQISLERFYKEQRMKQEKLYEVNGNTKLPTHRDHCWHRAEWVSDFSKMKELYPNVEMYDFFDTKYNGFFECKDDGKYIYKPSKQKQAKIAF